ncbi:hypothetical protein [Natrinema halophilum]|uniref:Uncharacterized protein n=1 Tax=Natrinema halophilum TaxID=1699371 RepID=A0A7D5K4L6_9EURY|nr:hypothetical protein [Natrinema halophilum]QLG47683.1 hypothetical protein HYG82_01890 [Natrinema halophilum]
MRWRCTWCGKPHEENDPPCDACGHNTFEKAIVRVDENGDRTEDEPAVSESVDTGRSFVWTCTECGREHVRNSPPCSRCGNPQLVQTEQTYDGLERDLSAPGWLEVMKPYVPVVIGFALVAAVFATGLVSLPDLPGSGPPAPPDAPGEGTEASGIDLETTEEVIHERLEAERSGSRRYDDGLAAYAEYYNRAYVAIEYEDARVEKVSLDDFGIDCHGTLDEGQLPYTFSIADYDDEATLADGVVERLQSGDVVTGSGYDVEGIDIHVVDGSVYVFYATC